MRKVVFAINISTDGYCSHRDLTGSIEILEYYITLLRNADLMLFGRNSYQIMVPYWPDIARSQSETEAENEFARVFDSLDEIVFSTTLKNAEGKNTRIVRKLSGRGARVEATVWKRHLCRRREFEYCVPAFGPRFD